MTGLTEIVVKGQIDKNWFDNYSCTRVEHVNNTTIVNAFIPDESSLHGMLYLFRDLNITLISINPINNNIHKS